MQRLFVRLALIYLAFSSGVLGLWATLAPKSWFDNFPGGGHHWVAVDGPYNHHLAGDVGALFLALFVVTVAALFVESAVLVRVAGVAWIVSGAPHLLYHLGHRAGLGSGDQAVSLGGLVTYVVLGAVCVALAPALERDRRAVQPA